MSKLSLWTEKYRPSEFSEVKGQEAIVSRIQAFVEKKNMPHLLFAGPAGVGKTTLALVIAKQLFGADWRNNILELNASDERGIDVVRNKVKDFARTRAIGDHPFKIVYLDEADALTKEAQQALRRTMENYTQTTRFILSCNYSSKLIDPIQSRCAVFRFKLLPKKDVLDIIQYIAEQENLSVSDDAKESLYEVTRGDCRRVENLLQTCAALSKEITAENVFSMASFIKPTELNEVLSLALQNQFIAAREKLLKLMLDYSLSGLDVLKQIQKEIWKLELDNKKKMKLVDKCAEIEFRMTEGSDEYVQLEALLSQIALAGID